MTTRKLAACLLGAGALLAGCATPGALHVYTLESAQAGVVRDTTDAAPPATVPDFLAPGESITGFAYDPFTDHFFLRLAPGNRIRVVDRPARAVKREFTVETLPSTGGGDLAVRPRDGHLFLAHPNEPSLIELNRFGQFVHTIALAGSPGPAAGVAFDSERDRLLIYTNIQGPLVTVYDLGGRLLESIKLDRAVMAGTLGFDSDLRELYAPLADSGAVGVFGEDGRLRRSVPLSAAFLDVGPRSFLRMF